MQAVLLYIGYKPELGAVQGPPKAPNNIYNFNKKSGSRV